MQRSALFWGPQLIEISSRLLVWFAKIRRKIIPSLCMAFKLTARTQAHKLHLKTSSERLFLHFRPRQMLSALHHYWRSCDGTIDKRRSCVRWTLKLYSFVGVFVPVLARCDVLTWVYWPVDLNHLVRETWSGEFAKETSNGFWRCLQRQFLLLYAQGVLS